MFPTVFLVMFLTVHVSESACRNVFNSVSCDVSANISDSFRRCFCRISDLLVRWPGMLPIYDSYLCNFHVEARIKRTLEVSCQGLLGGMK